MNAYRVEKARYRSEGWTGAGAALQPGRWNQAGEPMVYAAETRALAILEVLVHVKAKDTLMDRLLGVVEFDPDVVERVMADDLPSGWSRLDGLEACRAIGSRWLKTQRSLVLAVPSAVVPEEWNYLINPNHPRYARVRTRPFAPLPLDSRLTALRSGSSESPPRL